MLQKDCFTTKVQIDGLVEMVKKAKLQNNKIASESFQLQLDGLLKNYNEINCGVDLIMDRCLYLTNQIELTTSDLNYYSKQVLLNGTLQGKVNNLTGYLADLKKEALGLNCVAKVEESRQKVVSNIIDQYSSLDKARIETQSKAQVQKRVVIGGIVLLTAFVMIIIFSSNTKK